MIHIWLSLENRISSAKKQMIDARGDSREGSSRAGVGDRLDRSLGAHGGRRPAAAMRMVVSLTVLLPLLLVAVAAVELGRPAAASPSSRNSSRRRRVN